MDLDAVSLYCDEAKNPPGYLVDICEDMDGQPSTRILGSAGFVPKGKSWITVPVVQVHIFLAGKPKGYFFGTIVKGCGHSGIDDEMTAKIPKGPGIPE